jgi:uncharacterized lipoprotein YbaY
MLAHRRFTLIALLLTSAGILGVAPVRAATPADVLVGVAPNVAITASSLGYDPKQQSAPPLQGKSSEGRDKKETPEEKKGRDNEPGRDNDRNRDNDRDRDPRDNGPQDRFAPPGFRPDQERRWRLGVGVDVGDVGVRITGVEFGSAAARIGLEPGDIIVTVGGQQVGRLQDRVVDLGDALNAAADFQGRVRLVIQNRRNNELLAIDVWLERSDGHGGQPSAVTGRVLIREPLTLPPNAELKVRLVQRGGIFSPQRVVTSRTYTIVNRQPPIEFELPFDPNVLSNRETYMIEAEIGGNGRRWFATDQGYDVLTHGNPSHVEVWLERVR